MNFFNTVVEKTTAAFTYLHNAFFPTPTPIATITGPGGSPLTSLGADGVFYIRGVKYTIVCREEGGLLGAGGFGRVWRARRDKGAPPLTALTKNEHSYSSWVNKHVEEWTLILLNSDELCIKLCQVATSACQPDHLLDEISLQSEAGRFVEGVLFILGVVPMSKNDRAGPVRYVDPKWTEHVPGSGRLKKGGACIGTTWAMIAVELGEKGTLRRWTDKLNRRGEGLHTVHENIQKKAEKDFLASRKRKMRDDERKVFEATLPKTVAHLSAREAQAHGVKKSIFAGVDGMGNEDLVRGVMYRLCTTIKQLHQKLRMLHLDIKMDNIAVNNKWEVCLIDFGMAARIDDLDPSSRTGGTPGFRAPEHTVSDKLDVFALGMVLASMLLSCDLALRQTHKKKDPRYDTYFSKKESLGLKAFATWLQKHGQSHEISEAFVPQVPPECVSTAGATLAEKMVYADPSSRPTLDDVLDDPWFKEGRLVKDNEEWKILVRRCVASIGISNRVFLEGCGNETFEILNGQRGSSSKSSSAETYAIDRSEGSAPEGTPKKRKIRGKRA